MLFVRLHLDDTDSGNGAMEIALGSHLQGAISASSAASLAANCQTEICAAKRGDVLVLNMLTLHRSAPSRSESERRAIRIDFAGEALPEPLR